MSQIFQGRRTPAELPDSEVRHNNIVDFPRRPIDMLHAARATNDPDMLEAYSWHPIDEDRAFADEAMELAGEWLFLAAGAVCAVIVVVAFLYGRGVL